MSRKPRRKLTTNEWLLLGIVLLGIIMVALRWNYISHEVVESFKGYFN